MSELRKIREQLDAKFVELRDELQSNCPHEEISDWMEEWWALGHTTGDLVKQCNRCGMEMERARGFVDYQHEDGTVCRSVHVYSKEELAEMEQEEEKAFKALEEAIERDQIHGNKS